MMRSQVQTMKQMFQRYRRPGNLYFASIFLIFSLLLLTQIGSQAKWLASGKWSSQPALWPSIAIVGMSLFAALNWISAFVSPRIEGRWAEVVVWIRSLEFVGWFMVYVAAVPLLGYLFSTIIFAVTLTLRMGYRSRTIIVSAALTAVAVVLTFKAFLQVKVPGGLIYEYFPDSVRSFMLTYL